MIRVQCPECAGRLEQSANVLLCTGCAREWAIQDDVPVLTQAPTLYPKEYVTPDQFDAWLSDIRSCGWAEAGERLLGEMDRRGQKRQSVERLSFDESRADFHHVIPLRRTDVVLDYGTGLGSILFGLQPHAGHVVGLDQSIYRARLIRTRAAAIAASNVTAVCGGNSPRLPFETATFDLVVMNGVLEWTPRAQDGRPTDVHRRVLREVARVLKPGGALYLAIENRFGYRYLWGRRDSHNAGRKLPYVTVLPRWVANVYTQAASRVPYRTWLHSYRGLRALLGESGFSRTSFFFPYPTYNHFKYLIPLDGGTPSGTERTAAAVDYVLRHEPVSRRERWALAGLRRHGLIRHFAQDFAVVARTIGGVS